MSTNELIVSIWVSVVGFFLLGVIAVIGFYMIARELAKVNAVQAAIFLQMRKSFLDFDVK
jgi:hypothetical protein